MSRIRSHLSIGEVLKELKEEFPDISISKIRFLESEGLVEPDRTVSGYRKFSESDLARLKYILRLQRDQFMPLKIIRKRLEHFDPSQLGVPEQAPPNGAASPQSVKVSDDDELTTLPSGLQLSWDELVSSSGIDADKVAELEEYGLIDRHSADGLTFYDEDDLVVARIARDFAKYGIEPRHLKMFRNFAEREAGLFEQIVTPRAAGSEGRRQVVQSLTELAKLSKRLKQILLKAGLRDWLHE